MWDRRGCGVLRRLDSFLLLFSDQAEKSRERLSGNRYFGVISQHALVVITDLEPDDRLAIHLLASRFGSRQLALVGTTVMHAGRKKILTRRLLDQLGLDKVPVIQGSGGKGGAYPSIASSAAARTYADEGKGILSEEELLIAEQAALGSPDLSQEIWRLLKAAKEKEIVFAVMAAPTDLVTVLKQYPDLKEKIGAVYIMGGWVEAFSADGAGAVQRFATYNWNMDPEAAKTLFEIEGIQTILFSSHIIKPTFGGGSINEGNYPDIINALRKAGQSMPSILEGFIAGESWDRHLIATIPTLGKIIGSFAGQQFTPADPLLAAAMIDNDRIIMETEKVSVRIAVNEVDFNRGYEVKVVPDASSSVEMVTRIDRARFEVLMVEVLDRLPTIVAMN